MSHVLLLCAHPSSPSWNTAHSAATGPLIRVTETPLATAGSYIQPGGFLDLEHPGSGLPFIHTYSPHPGAGISGVGRDCEPPVPCPDSDMAEGPLHISRHSDCRITSQDLGASGWNRHRLLAAPDSGCGRSSPVEKDEEGAARWGQAEGGASERGVGTPSFLQGQSGTETQRDGEKENWRGERLRGG